MAFAFGGIRMRWGFRRVVGASARGVKLGAAALLSTLVLGVGGADAYVFDLNYTAGSNVIAAVLTTTYDSVANSYTATSATGTWNGTNISLVAVNGFFGNDNVVLYGQSPFLDINGVSFWNGSANVNVFYATAGNGLPVGYGLDTTTDPANAVSATSESLVQVDAPGPIPGTGLLSLLALLSAGLAKYVPIRRARVAAMSLRRGLRLLRARAVALLATGAVAFIALSSVGGGAAQATIFDLNYSNGGNVVTAVITATFNAAANDYLATSATGTYNGTSISLAAPGSAPVNTTNDNLLYPTGVKLDTSGIDFHAGTKDISLLVTAGGTVKFQSANTNGSGHVNSFGGTLTLTQVPAPGPVPGVGTASALGLLLTMWWNNMRLVRATRARLARRSSEPTDVEGFAQAAPA